ncbi:MAG: N-formylglutamate amidohydrolase [Planctomycetes bacterium]|nr:N-formylglutamate amidohydrolase [Planctomycetota bacterium]
MRDAFDFDRSCEPPYEFVPVDSGRALRPVPPAFRDQILVDTVHDGVSIPAMFRFDDQGRPKVDPEHLRQRFVEERDWGASLVASRIAQELGISGFHRIRLARVLLDFNRFPGSTPPRSTDHLERLAINPPFNTLLSHEEKTALLEGYYDRVSTLLERALVGKLIKIGVHSYDELNPSSTRRPDVSLISRPRSYQEDSKMAHGIFDPMFPDLLAESTCSRTLLHRMSLNLERAGFRVGHNHPYLLPEGSIEVRTQVWYFFLYLKERFLTDNPETAVDPAYDTVWSMLLNTNLRLQESDALRGYLHRYHRVPALMAERFRRARFAYDHVKAFLAASTVLEDYQRSPLRPSALVIEVRKDLLCEFNPKTGHPQRLFEEHDAKATEIARVIAEAITIFLETDREQLKQSESMAEGDPLQGSPGSTIGLGGAPAG